jgi:putative endonuclease
MQQSRLPKGEPRMQRPESLAAMPVAAACWYVYLIECSNGCIYTGISNDVERRYAAHLAGRGARYTRANPPLRLLLAVPVGDRAAASRAEYRIRRLSPAAKRALTVESSVLAEHR